MSASTGNGEKVFHGIAVSAGVVRATIHVLGKTQLSVTRRAIPDEKVPHEIVRLEKALLTTRQQIQEVQSRLSESMRAEHAAIFDAHLLVL